MSRADGNLAGQRQRNSLGRFLPGTNISLETSFWAKVNKDGPKGCWLWRAYKQPSGYGQFRVGDYRVQAYRFAYELLIGPIPSGMTIDHLCRNRACVNPSHLEPVTHRVNILRGVGLTAAHARAIHCLKGHPFDLFNTYMTPNGKRNCRVCRRQSDQRYRSARTAWKVAARKI